MDPTQFLISGGSAGGQRDTAPQIYFLRLPPIFLERYTILNFDYIFTADTCDLGICTKNEHDTID